MTLASDIFCFSLQGNKHIIIIMNGLVEFSESLVGMYPELSGIPLHIACRSRNQETHLHTAAKTRRLDITRELLNACPQSLEEVTSVNLAPLRVATFHDQSLKYLSANGFGLHVYTVKDSGFTAFKILAVTPPQHGNIDMEIERILRRAGGLRARDLAPTFKTCYNGVVIDRNPVAPVRPMLSISSCRNKYLSWTMILTLVMAGLVLVYLINFVALEILKPPPSYVDSFY